MAIVLNESKFTDIYGNITNEFKANAGDVINVKHKFESEISFISSQQNQVTIDKLENKLSRSQGSFLSDGFRAGQSYTLRLITNVNTIHETWTGTISFVSDLYITVNSIPTLNFTTVTDYVCVLIANSNYDSLNFALNFVDNDIPLTTSPTLESIIDQESSRFNVNGINSLTVNDTLPLIQIGKKSGQFTIANPVIKRLADVSNPYTAFTSTRKQYEISFDVVLPAMFSPENFIGTKCLRYYSKSFFKVLSTENLAPTIVEYNQNANTGLWNEGYNADQADSTESSTITDLYFNKTNTFTITAKCPTALGITQVELGGMYFTTEDDFKNQENPQDYYLPFVKSGLIGVADIGNDWVSSTTRPFNLGVSNFTISDAGGERTFTIELVLFTFYNNPNGFGKFIESRGELDRQFLLWIKVGNTNRLLFDGQLQFEQALGQPFDNNTYGFVNHDNILDYKDITIANSYSNDDFNKEDDISYISEFELNKNDVNQSVTAKVVVKNLATDFEFVLDKLSFDLSSIDLQYFINQEITNSNFLPDSSNKNVAFLYQKTPLTGDILEVRMFYPIIINWRYWEEVLSTHPFFVSQNKNNNDWLNYLSLPWKIYVKTEIQRNNVVDYNYEELNFLNYDSWTGTSTIELFDTTETIQYNSLNDDSTVMIKATHVFPANYSGFPWGMITIEEKESSPRWILSTEIDRTQGQNPLVGITNIKRCDIEFHTADTIILRCYVNTNLLSGSNFCISSKISEEGMNNINPDEVKLTEDTQEKVTEDLQNKITE